MNADLFILKISECEYPHVTLVCNDSESYKCEGCKGVWTDKECVVEQIIEGKLCNFCLNCNDWIHFKANVFDYSWSLLDSFSNLMLNI